MEQIKVSDKQILDLIEKYHVHIGSKIKLADAFIEYLDKLTNALIGSDTIKHPQELENRIIGELGFDSYLKQFWFVTTLSPSPQLYPKGFPVPSPPVGEEAEIYKKQYIKYMARLDRLKRYAYLRDYVFYNIFTTCLHTSELVTHIACDEIDTFMRIADEFGIVLQWEDFNDLVQWLNETYEPDPTISFDDIYRMSAPRDLRTPLMSG